MNQRAGRGSNSIDIPIAFVATAAVAGSVAVYEAGCWVTADESVTAPDLTEDVDGAVDEPGEDVLGQSAHRGSLMSITMASWFLWPSVAAGIVFFFNT